ncbi:hypothetical protein KEM52_002264 [Ascosphaera acerosa]|nr:hypothetical protein KEM52_002264 [Ascosphaera acerosa]
MELQLPSVLAQLPRPLAVSSGRFHFGESTGLSAGKRRRRYELVATIDGEGVNIYNVQFPKLVTSYATPPQSSFSCAPCSVRQKGGAAGETVRWTYVALAAPETKLQCFVDKTGNSIETRACRLPSAEAPVISLDTVQNVASTTRAEDASTDDFDVIAIHKDGTLRRLSADLESVRAKARLNPSVDGGVQTSYHVAAAYFLSLEDAQKSLLRRRQDAIAEALSHGGASTILVVIHQPADATTISPSDVAVSVHVLPATTHTAPRHLFSLTLPVLTNLKPVDAAATSWDIKAATGLLTFSSLAGVVSYDISCYSPQVSSSLIFEEGQVPSSVRVSPQSLMAVKDSTVAIYNTRYHSVQAYAPLQQILDIVPEKSRLPGSRLQFVTYFAKLGLAIAACGTYLLAFDLAPVQGKMAATSRKHSRDGLLINAIGRGIPASQPSLQAAQIGSLTTQQWNDVKVRLQACADAKDAAKFDEIVRQELSHCDEKKAAKHMPSTNSFVHPDQVQFLLAKIFTLQLIPGSTGYKLAVTFLPTKTFHWLVHASYLTSASVKLAIRQAQGLEALPHLEPGAMIRAIIEAKPSLRCLNQVLRGPGHLDADELTYTIQSCLDIARKHTPAPDANDADATVSAPAIADVEQDQLALTATPEDPAAATAIAVAAKPIAPSTEAVLVNAVTALNLSLSRLALLPQPTVVSSIRSNLSNSDTLTVIHHLRHALATGGYTSRAIEPSPAMSKTNKVPTLSLSTIVSSLTACIDAIGPSGWISAAAFADSADSHASLIADVRTEVSAALAGVEEAAYLKGILREFIRYSETVQPGSRKDIVTGTGGAAIARADTGKLRVKRRERQHGAEIVVYETPDYASGALGPEDAQLLPLTLKKQDDAQEITRTKTNKGTGEVIKRSTREMGYLRRKAVGKYSFERVIL